MTLFADVVDASAAVAATSSRSAKVATLADLNMLAFLPGRERSLEEFDTLLFSAGLRRIAIRPTASPQSIIEDVAA